jgi:ArsR family transcriptional regulator
MHYSIVLPKQAGAARMLTETLSVLSADRAKQTDLSKLKAACCEPRKLLVLEGAPLPISVEAANSCSC